MIDSRPKRPTSIDVYDRYYVRQLKGEHGLTRASDDLVRLLVRGRVVPSSTGEQALDFGVGDGRHSEYLLASGFSVTGTDVSDTPLEVASRRLKEAHGFRATLVNRSSRLPFATDAFSLVVAWEVLHWLGDPESWMDSMAEFTRVLRPGGHLILTMPTERHYLKKYALEVGKSTYLCKTAERMDCRFYSPNLYTLEHMFEKELGLVLEQTLCYENGSTVTEQSLDERFSMYGFLLVLPEK